MDLGLSDSIKEYLVLFLDNTNIFHYFSVK